MCIRDRLNCVNKTDFRRKENITVNIDKTLWKNIKNTSHGRRHGEDGKGRNENRMEPSDSPVEEWYEVIRNMKQGKQLN